jgi:hypothetical protein
MCFLKNLFGGKRHGSKVASVSPDDYVVPTLKRCILPETEELKRRRAEEELIAKYGIRVEKAK